MSYLRGIDRFKKCLNCGSEEHRAKDCDRPNKAGKSGPKEQNPKPGAQVAQVTPFPSAASTSQPIVQATPVLSPDLLQQAAEMYRQLQAMQVPQATQPLSGRGWELPQTAKIRASQTPILAAKTRVWEEVKMVGLKAKMATSAPSPPFRLENWDLGQKRLCPKPIAYALLDSGATHPMRQAKDQGEWDEAVEVQVSNSTLMRLTQSGTLLLPPLERAGSAQPIAPMGAVIEQLGYSLVWSAGSCKLYSPHGKPLRLRVKNGCPEVVESQALTLISRFGGT